MAPLRIVGIFVLLIGIILFIIGLNASESFTDQVSNFFTGTFTDSTMWYLVGGAAMAIGGALMAIFGARKALK